MAWRCKWRRNHLTLSGICQAAQKISLKEMPCYWSILMATLAVKLAMWSSSPALLSLVTSLSKPTNCTSSAARVQAQYVPPIWHSIRLSPPSKLWPCSPPLQTSTNFSRTVSGWAGLCIFMRVNGFERFWSSLSWEFRVQSAEVQSFP